MLICLASDGFFGIMDVITICDIPSLTADFEEIKPELEGVSLRPSMIAIDPMENGDNGG